MSRTLDWLILGAAIVALGMVVWFGARQWLRADTEWVLPDWQQYPEELPGPVTCAELDQLASGQPGRAGELTADQWEQLDPDAQADTLIAEWHDEVVERTVSTDTMRLLDEPELLLWDCRRQVQRIRRIRSEWKAEMNVLLGAYRTELEHRRAA